MNFSWYWPLFFLSLLLWAGSATAAEETDRPASSVPRVIQVQGSDLTGLNAGGVVGTLKQIHAQGVDAVVLDLSGITHMTEAGMDALVTGAKLFGMDRFAAAGLSGDAADLATTKGAGRFNAYPSVEDAMAALGK